MGGPVFGDVRSALYDVENGPRIVDYIYGIGGRDVTPDHIRTVYADLAKIADTGQVENLLTYLGSESRGAHMATLKELSKKEVLISSGHRACAGCGFPVIIKQALLAAENPVVVSCATGCMEVCTTIYPYTAWKVPFIHNAFENSASTLSGVEAAYKSLSRQGKIDKKIDFIAFGGDGGTYDIGFQALSGAMERGHNMLYICYDNQAYMNTGIQRSSATPRGGANTLLACGNRVVREEAVSQGSQCNYGCS